MIKNYYNLAKPGIVYGNLLTTLAGFLFASRWHFNPLLLFATLGGLALVIGSACVFNNFIDRDIDGLMQRTKDRALISGVISSQHAIAYGVILSLTGFFLLSAFVNILTALIALFGFIFYVVIYGYTKRASHWGTVVGSVSGAVPIVIGYSAFNDHLDGAAFILFLILVLWQMPHFYAISMYRLQDYVSAGIPVLPARYGMKITKIYIVVYIVAFIFAIALLTLMGYAGYIYLFIMLIIGLAWLFWAIQGFKAYDDNKWARQLFLFSLVVLVCFSVILSVASVLPI
jgi:protoheme IX farnesyltransferase